MNIITQGYLERFVIVSGYDFDVTTTTQTTTNILRLTDKFILEGHTQRTWEDFLIFQEPFVTTRVDNRFVTSPNWIVYVTKKGTDGLPIVPTYTTLYSINGSVLLPNPLFGDNQESVNEVLINQTVGGKRFSYVKTSKRKKLEYKFEFRYAKMVELQEFLDGSNTEWLTLINWKSEIWNVKIVNNPIVYTGVSPGWYSVEFDFEGYRVQTGIYNCLE